jgi:type IV pilus assembly protein PilO
MTVTRKWTVGAALVAVLILVAGWFLLISPKRAEVADLEAQAQSQVDSNSQLETELALLEQQYKDLPQKQAELSALRTQLPQAPELPSYIRQLQDLGKQSGVVLQSMTPAVAASIGVPPIAGSTALQPDALAAINVDIVVEGTYFEVTKFINDLETTERYTLVGGLNISESENGDDTASDPLLAATLNARIFLVPTAADVQAIPSEAPTTTTAP